MDPLTRVMRRPCDVVRTLPDTVEEAGIFRMRDDEEGEAEEEALVDG